MKIETENFIVNYEDSEELRNKVFEAVIEFYKTHESFNGECICQSDVPMIEAPYTLAEIADEVIKFDVKCK